MLYFTDSLDSSVSSNSAGMLNPLTMNSISGVNSPPDIKPDLSQLGMQQQSPQSSYFGGYSPGMQATTSQPSPGMHSPGLHSPSSSVSSPTMMSIGSPGSASSPTNPHMAHSSLSSKHICAICGDRASGKHYGVYR